MLLAEKRCIPCHGEASALTRKDAENYLKQVQGWSLSDNVSMAIYFDPLLANKIDPPVYV